MKVGITGGAGFIGANLVEFLANKGYEVAVIDNLETGNLDNLKASRHEFEFGDLRDLGTVRKFLSRTKVEHIVHLGALGSVPRSISQPRLSFFSNAVSTLNVLEAAKEFQLPITFSSSSSVYGKNPKLPKIETDWLAPISPYAASKVSAEALCMAFRESYELSVTIYRLFNVYGPRQNPESIYAAVLPKWIFAAFRKEPIIVFGDGEQKRDFTYVEDVISIIHNSIKERHNPNYPTNLAFGRPISLNKILDIFIEYFGKLEIQYHGIRKGDVRDSESNPEQLYKLHEEKIDITPLEVGLVRTFEWFKKNYDL